MPFVLVIYYYHFTGSIAFKMKKKASAAFPHFSFVLFVIQRKKKYLSHRLPGDEHVPNQRLRHFISAEQQRVARIKLQGQLPYKLFICWLFVSSAVNVKFEFCNVSEKPFD